jgi:uncharacterized protein YjbJ (UPF0337 family)
MITPDWGRGELPGGLRAVSHAARKTYDTPSKTGEDCAMGAADKGSHKFDELKGRLKELVGRKSGRHDLERRGQAEQVKAKAREVGEELKDAAGKARQAARAAKDSLDR